jgi:hypothetical protein
MTATACPNLAMMMAAIFESTRADQKTGQQLPSPAGPDSAFTEKGRPQAADRPERISLVEESSCGQRHGSRAGGRLPVGNNRKGRLAMPSKMRISGPRGGRTRRIRNGASRAPGCRHLTARRRSIRRRRPLPRRQHLTRLGPSGPGSNRGPGPGSGAECPCPLDRQRPDALAELLLFPFGEGGGHVDGGHRAALRVLHGSNQTSSPGNFWRSGRPQAAALPTCG